jgi:transcriptional regulator with XRE-family HTH domain
MIEPAQIRAARALLGWRQEDLSKASGVGTATVRRIESANGRATSYISTLARIQAAFEAAGIVFIGDDGSSGMGVRIARSKRSKKK